ncbi:F-box protein At2g43440-like [Andrographis paniculata]|uniref:F-box protein At2g43440-like n=1 Tax=Andrographis paniculata TaxID=175694 RepID=UPI0021E8769E|nr:F-box protein At2g43440-like [Andrographis paniculata]
MAEADLLQLILMRLPVKSLLRFKSVSKTWNDTICSRDFALAHLHESKNNLSSLLSYRNMFLFESLDQRAYNVSRLMENNELKPLLGLKSEYCILPDERCCCDGLMLVQSRSGIVIWNLSTRTYTDLGFPFPDRAIGLCGIGFDPLTKDYKIVAADTFHDRYTVFNNRNGHWNELKSMGTTFEDDIKNFPFNGRMINLYYTILGRGNNSYNIEMFFFNFCILVGDIYRDKCRIVWKRTGGEWMEFDDLPILGTELWMGCSMSDPRIVDLYQISFRMYLIDYNDRELIFTIHRDDNSCFVIYNLIERKSRVISKPDGVFYERPLMGYLDNLFFTT